VFAATLARECVCDDACSLTILAPSPKVSKLSVFSIDFAVIIIITVIIKLALLLLSSGLAARYVFLLSLVHYWIAARSVQR
jgi:hypothetical protein